MTKKLGVTKEYIADNMTIQQMRLFFDTLNRQDVTKLKTEMALFYSAVGAAMSGKGEAFKKMLDKLGVPEDINENLKQAEKEGFNIEVR